MARMDLQAIKETEKELEEKTKENICQDLTIAELEIELEKKQEEIEKLKAELEAGSRKNSEDILLHKTQNDALEKKTEMLAKKIDYLEKNYTGLFQKYKGFRNSAYYHAYKSLQALKQTKLGKVISRLI